MNARLGSAAASPIAALACAYALVLVPADAQAHAAGISTHVVAGARAASGLVVIPHSASEPALSYLVLHAARGRTERAGTIELLNPTARRLRVALAPVDALTLDTLGSAYRPSGTREHGVTRWLRLTGRRLTLAPHARASALVDVRVPRRYPPGDYLAGVSVEALGQSASVRRAGRLDAGRTAAVSVVRYAIGVEVSLPGRRRPLIRFTGAAVRQAPAGLSFELDARNAGNAILKGVYGHVRIMRDGRTILSRAIAAGTFVAATSIAYPVTAFDQHPSEGTRYGIEASLHYARRVAYLDTTVTFGHREAQIQQRFGSSRGGGGGWWEIALLAAVALYGLITTVLLLRRRTRDRHGDDDDGPDAGAPGATAPGAPLRSLDAGRRRR
ncbi:MAG TPA: hypothetical protein VGX69_06355 [Solirubrobacteraceae bacterium]|jgi:hypothetical protein|nr:hypothetical protein [Solirubrobacteraceae bacterium]